MTTVEISYGLTLATFIARDYWILANAVCLSYAPRWNSWAKV